MVPGHVVDLALAVFATPLPNRVGSFCNIAWSVPSFLAAFGGFGPVGWLDRELHWSFCVSLHPSDRGFTLIEVLVALVLVSVLVAGAMGLLAKAAAVIRLARVSTTAALLAMQKVEQLRAAPAVLVSGTQQDYFAADSRVSPAASAFFVRRWTVTPGWAETGGSSVVVEVLAVGSGRVAQVQAVVGGLP